MGSQLLAPLAGPWTGCGIAGETVGSSLPVQSVARASIPDRDVCWSPGLGRRSGGHGICSRLLREIGPWGSGGEQKWRPRGQALVCRTVGEQEGDAR